MKVIPALNQVNKMLDVEQWIIDEACKQCARFVKESGNDDFFININLETSLIGRETIIKEILTAKDKYGLKNKNLFFEVTESAPLEGKEDSIDTLRTLQQMGINIAIDDFGTGFSSLSYLKTLPVDEIKIDRSFVLNSESDKSAENFLSEVINLTKNMGYKVCVEGVENTKQFDIINSKSIDFYQGFYFGRHTKADSFIKQFLKE